MQSWPPWLVQSQSQGIPPNYDGIRPQRGGWLFFKGSECISPSFGAVCLSIKLCFIFRHLLFSPICLLKWKLLLIMPFSPLQCLAAISSRFIYFFFLSHSLPALKYQLLYNLLLTTYISSAGRNGLGRRTQGIYDEQLPRLTQAFKSSGMYPALAFCLWLQESSFCLSVAAVPSCAAWLQQPGCRTSVWAYWNISLKENQRKSS